VFSFEIWFRGSGGLAHANNPPRTEPRTDLPQVYHSRLETEPLLASRR